MLTNPLDDQQIGQHRYAGWDGARFRLLRWPNRDTFPSLSGPPRRLIGESLPALNLARSICSNGERGLLGVAVDPNFNANNFVYVYHTFHRTGSCATGVSAPAVNRVARYTLAISNTIDPVIGR